MNFKREKFEKYLNFEKIKRKVISAKSKTSVLR
jgi:hypothetical protein